VTAWDWVKKRATLALPRGQLFRSVITLAGGTALGQVVTVLASPVLTRLYAPEDFGVLAVYSSVLGIVSVIASLRYELAIPLPEDDKDAAALLVLSLGVVTAISLLTGVSVWLLGEQITVWANAPALQPYLWLLPLGVGMVGTYQVFNYWAIRKGAFGAIARTRLYQGVGASLTQISLGFLRVGPLGLLTGQVVGQAAGITTLAALTHMRDKITLEAMTMARVSDIARRYQRFPKLSCFSGLINSAGLQLPALLLASFYGPQVAGWFALGQRVVGMPMSLMGQAVAQAYMGTACHLVRQNSRELRLFFVKTAVRLFFLGSIPVTLIAVGGPCLFTRLFGTGWGEAGLYMQVLALMLLPQFVTVPLSQTLNILEHQDWQLGWDLGRLLLVIGSMCLAYWLGGTPRQTIVAYSLSMFIAYAVLFSLNVHILNVRVNNHRER